MAGRLYKWIRFLVGLLISLVKNSHISFTGFSNHQQTQANESNPKIIPRKQNFNVLEYNFPNLARVLPSVSLAEAPSVCR